MKLILALAILLALTPYYGGEQRIPTLTITVGGKTNTFRQDPHFVPYDEHIQSEKNAPFFTWVSKEAKAALRLPFVLHSKDGTNAVKGLSLNGLNAVLEDKEFRLYVWSGTQNYGQRTQGNKWVDDNYLAERYFIWFNPESKEVITSDHADNLLRKEVDKKFSILRYLIMDRYIGELVGKNKGES